MMIYIPTTVQKDPKRGFSDAQRCAIWNLSPHKCADCHTALNDLSEMHADHVVPHSKGGQTSVANGQPLCKQCNLKKSNSLK
jgi:5-methylcytosine-specific restriction endonuclease McrA